MTGLRRRVTVRTSVLLAALAVFVVTLAVIAARFPLRTASADVNQGLTIQPLKSVSWRMRLLARKAAGELPELAWADLGQMLRLQGGFGLQAVADDGGSVAGSLKNPYTSGSDIQAGASVFRERCAPCHGGDGSGVHGPALNRPGLRSGDSEISLYRVLTKGINNTSMRPIALDFQERWQVIAYVKHLQARALAEAAQDQPVTRISISSERMRTAGVNTDEWITYSGSLDGQRYSALTEINTTNVAKLRLLWSRQIDTAASKLEATPIVAGGSIFITVPPATVIALDVRSGAVRWTFDHEVGEELKLCCGSQNRGLAILDSKLFFGTADGYLISIDANTGREVWSTRVVRPADGYSLTGAPLVVGRNVLTGVAGGEYPTRGFLAAYNADTGREAWRFNTIPGPDEPGHETWKSDAWKTGGGATWVTGGYDPSLGLVYWGVGNPNPEFNGEVRPGDNLYTNSVVALHADSGKLAWFFQFTPHDEHDWDSAQTPILVDLPINGIARRVICWANRNGFYYVLDRTTGEFLVGKTFVEQTWSKGLNSRGRPILSATSDVSESGRFAKPGVSGGTNWQNSAFDRDNGLILIPAVESPGGIFTKAPTVRASKDGTRLGSSGSQLSPTRPVVRALDATSGVQRWERFAPDAAEFGSSYGGLLATKGGLVFGAARGQAFALESSTGKERWSVFLWGRTLAPPISYTVDGSQVISLLAGRTLYTFGL